MGCLTDTTIIKLKGEDYIMRNTQVYNVTVGNEVVEVTTLKEVKTLLGDKKITTKAILAGEYEGIVTLSEMEEQSTANLDEEIHTTPDTLPDTVEEFMEQKVTLQDIVEASDKVEIILVGDAPNTAPSQDEALTNTEDEVDEDTPLPTPEDIEPTNTDTGKEYPEVGDFEDEKAIKKYTKGLSDAELAEWVEIEGVEYKPNDHQAINRMRMAMAIKGLHFPDTVAKKGSTKKKSKYGDFTTEDLVQMAIDNDIEVRDDKGDMRILRMYTIMALKDAGLLEA